jgi:hypothetical protein
VSIRGRLPGLTQRLRRHQDIALEIALDKLRNFGARVGAGFIQSINADIDRPAVDQAL